MENILIVFSGKAQSGKCFGKNTPIMMFDGSTKMVQDIKTGDLLMGDDSTPRKVLNTIKGKGELYKIKQSRGIDYIVNKDHILSLKWTHYNNRYKTGEKKDVELSKYLLFSKSMKRHLYGYINKIKFCKKKLCIDPYFLGLWLGDGNSANQGITTADKEIKNYLIEYAKYLNLKIRDAYAKTKKRTNKASTYYITAGNNHIGQKNTKNILFSKLKLLNIINNKHIPEIYKTSSINQRLQLLAGLLDSDGFYNGRGEFEIIQKNKKLAEDIVWVARSLGFYSSIVKTKKECVNNGVWGTYYRIGIYGKLENIPNKVPRKIAMIRVKKTNSCLSSIRIKKLKNGNYYGFTLDGNHRFLLEDFTVVHNSTSSTILEKIIKENDSSSHIVRFSFATALKDIATHYFGWDGDKNIYYNNKGEVIQDKGRMLLINVGQAFRNIRPTIWADIVMNKIKDYEKLISSNTFFIIDDMRFLNEKNVVELYPRCTTIRLSRISELKINDISENDLDSIKFDYYIENNNDIDNLRIKLVDIIKNIRKD